MKLTKTFRIAPLAIVLWLLALAGTSRLTETRTYNRPFPECEQLLLTNLHLDQDKLLSEPQDVQARAEGDLAREMRMKLYAVSLGRSEDARELSFTCRHVYDIGASGSESIRFDLTAIDPAHTKIAVTYRDVWNGIWPPFVFWNPGPIRQWKIHRLIWGSN